VKGILGKPVPIEVWEVLAASALLAWRILSYPAATLWRDWVAVLGMFWILTAAAGRRRGWPVALALGMAFLFALYAVRQVPWSLAVLRAIR